MQSETSGVVINGSSSNISVMNVMNGMSAMNGSGGDSQSHLQTQQQKETEIVNTVLPGNKIPGFDVPELIGLTHVPYVYNPVKNQWERRNDEEIHQAEVQHRRESGVVYSEFTVSTVVFSEDHLINTDTSTLNSEQIAVATGKYEEILQWLKKIQPHVILFINITVEFFLCFTKEEWVQKIYHLSDDAQCAHIAQWKLGIACSVGLDKFEISELYSSVAPKNIVLDDGTSILEKNDDIHHALTRTSSNTPPPAGHDLCTHQNNSTDKSKSPHASKYQQKQEEQYEKKLMEATSPSGNQSNHDSKDNYYNHTKSPRNGSISMAGASGMDVPHVKSEYYLLRAFIELGILPITVSCVRYSHRFLDRKKQFAQVYKFIADQDMESVLCGESCDMVYKQPKQFVHVWTLCDDTDSLSSDEEEVQKLGSNTNKDKDTIFDNEPKNKDPIKPEKNKAKEIKLTDTPLPLHMPSLKDNSSGDFKFSRRSSQGSPFFRPSFISLNLEDLALNDIRVRQDKGVFNLLRSVRWKVENIERLEVLDKEKMIIDVEDMDNEESKEEEADQFGDDIICRAQCVYFST